MGDFRRECGAGCWRGNGAAAPATIAHTHLIDGFSASIWRRARRAGLPVIHTAHDYHLLCPRAILLDPHWHICHRPDLACRLYRAWHLRTASAIDLFVSPSRFLLDRHQQAGFAPRREACLLMPVEQEPRWTDEQIDGR